MEQRKNVGVWFIFLGALFWSLNAPLVKFIHLDPLLVCGLRSLLAGLALSPFIRLNKLRWNRWMLLYIASYTALCICVIVALKQTAAAIAIGMQYTAMLWLFLVRVLRKEKIHRKALIPVLLIFGGVVLFMSTGTDGSSGMGNIIALSEGVFFACISVSSSKAAGDNPLGLTAVANLCAGLFVFLALPPTFADVTRLDAQSWLIMLILGVVQIGAGYGFYNIGLKYVAPQKASIIALWELILGPVWVAVFLKEYPTPAVMLGFAVIIAGMVLNAIWSAQRKSAEASGEIRA